MYPVARLKTVGSLHLGGPEIWNRDTFYVLDSDFCDFGTKFNNFGHSELFLRFFPRIRYMSPRTVKTVQRWM